MRRRAGSQPLLDWVAIDHFNTARPHTHVVTRGRDEQGRELVVALDYIGHGVRARAQALITLDLGPESEPERLQKLASKVDFERFTASTVRSSPCPGTAFLRAAVRTGWKRRSND